LRQLRRRGRSVVIVHSLTQATEFVSLLFVYV
jgi:hypothetical protein